jgi:branched-chain amino acid transport system substrate-binding protein
MDIDKVDVLMGAATNLIVAAMPMIMERKKMVMVLLALGSNAEFKYPRYFQSAPFGPDPKGVLSSAFFAVAKSLNPTPKTVALVGADAEFANNVLIGARENAKQAGLQIVYDRSYPPSTVDYTPIVRAVQATNPDVVLLASYPPDSVGMVRAATEVGLKTQLFGGAMVGMQYASLTRRRPRTPGSIRSGSISRRSPMRPCRCCNRPSQRPEASTTTSLPLTFTGIRSTPSWARSGSTISASGLARAR